MQRKDLLRKLLRPSETIRYSDHVEEKGDELLAMAKEKHLEGIVAKRRAGPYVGKRSTEWLRFKIVQDLDVVIGGWTDPRKSRDHFGALLMGLYSGTELHFVGSVGTGFDGPMLERTHKTLNDLKMSKSPFSTTPKLPEAVHWVRPELVARIKYGQWTKGKKLRQPVFLGFQEDRSPRDCKFDQETPEPARKNKRDYAPTPAKPRMGRASGMRVPEKNLEEILSKGREESISAIVNGRTISLTHLNKIYFPESSLRKRDVLLYYFRIAPHILPFLKDRPLVLKRYPNGITGDFFFQKEAPASRPDWVKTSNLFSKERQATIPYIVANDLETLLYLTNLGCIDHNPWTSRFDDEDHPDFLFFDLDPTQGTSFDAVMTVARSIHKELLKLGVTLYSKTSGASGFHIYVPLKRKYTYEETRLFAGAIGQRVQNDLPKLVTFERTVSKRRKGSALIDTLQNARGKPLAAVYSLRPFPGAPVSAPVTLSELKTKIVPGKFNIHTIFARLKHKGDLWSSFWADRQLLEKAVERDSAAD